MAHADDELQIVLDDSPPYLSRINHRFHSMSKTDQKLARFVMDQPARVVGLAIEQLADETGVSKASIVRFCQKLGYTGYAELRILLARDLGRPYQEHYADIARDDRPEIIAQKIFSRSMQGLRDSLDALDANQLHAASVAIKRASLVHIYGAGGSGGIGTVLLHRLIRCGVRAVAPLDPHAWGPMAECMHHTDVAFGISHSGTTRDVISAMERAQKAGAATIGICNYETSPFAKLLNIPLFTAVGATPLTSEAGISRIAQLAVLDALCILIDRSDS